MALGYGLSYSGLKTAFARIRNLLISNNKIKRCIECACHERSIHAKSTTSTTCEGFLVVERRSIGNFGDAQRRRLAS